jgi:hypothetical protein
MDNGITGYMFAAHSLKGSPIPIPGTNDGKQSAGGFVLTALAWDPEEDDSVEKAVQPMLREAKERWGDNTQLTLHSQRYESFLDWFDDFSDQGPVGMSEYMVSRHFNRKTLEDEKTLRRITEPAMKPAWGIAAFLVAGKGVREADIPGGANAVHPGWRDASILGSKHEADLRAQFTHKRLTMYGQLHGSHSLTMTEKQAKRRSDSSMRAGNPSVIKCLIAAHISTR